ncbi:MAG TPA: FAD/NAD(P)-binding protein, partial [Chthoniobacterales bacterium]|nr:FAD/NAD(P)-binding protein [Chthoniobacterales bacterium]
MNHTELSVWSHMNEESFHGVYDVIIVGAGYSGTLVAVQLARARANLRIALIERGKNAGRGVAYGTTDPKHLLNVRADQMGAFPDDIGHFYRWLEHHPLNLVSAGVTDLRPDAYIPRVVFGDYIQDLLRQASEISKALDVIHDEIVDMTRHNDGSFKLLSRQGKKLTGLQVVLALGNFPPGENHGTGKASDRPWFSNNPYSAETHAKLAEPGDILVIGTGLTSLDVLVTLAPIKQEGKIHILSRRGLFPQPHGEVAAYPTFFDFDHLPKTARELLRRVRREVRIAAAHGTGWRPVVDSIRPFNQAIWRNLGYAEQKRFLRHLRSFWDSHRHRCAPQVVAVKEW